jgi:putative Mg2+ transporter-C (MgtC) family protein
MRFTKPLLFAALAALPVIALGAETVTIDLGKYSDLTSVSTDYNVELILSVRIIVAAFLCAAIGMFHNREHGIDPLIYCAIATGSALFTAIMLHGYINLGNQYIMSGMGGLIAGIGFIGGSVIFRGEKQVQGIISAATLWATVAVGVACGFGMDIIAVVATVIVSALNFIQKKAGKIA